MVRYRAQGGKLWILINSIYREQFTEIPLGFRYDYEMAICRTVTKIWGSKFLATPRTITQPFFSISACKYVDLQNLFPSYC